MQMVRFSQSFDEDDAGEDDMRRLSSKPPLAPSGGSVSLAAQHFCPVCGIIATSQDNLEVPACCLCSHMPYTLNSPVSAASAFRGQQLGQHGRMIAVQCQLRSASRREQLGGAWEYGLGLCCWLHVTT